MKKLVNCLVVCTALAFAAVASAAPPDKPKQTKQIEGTKQLEAQDRLGNFEIQDLMSKATPGFLGKQKQVEGSFESLMIIIHRIESGKTIREGDAEAIEKQGMEYAKAFKEAYDQASADAQEAGDSKGEKGSVASFLLFEQTAKKHEQSVKGFQAKMEGIQLKLKAGDIKLDNQLLLKMSPTDKQQFKRFLSPKAFQEMQRLHPDLMRDAPAKSDLSPREETPGVVAEAIPVSIPCQFETFLDNLVQDLGPTKAEASIAWQCRTPCLQKRWVDCWNCIRSKGPQAVAAWNTFVNCWNGAGTCNGWPWNWWNCVQKARCLATLIYKLG